MHLFSHVNILGSSTYETVHVVDRNLHTRISVLDQHLAHRAPLVRFIRQRYLFPHTIVCLRLVLPVLVDSSDIKELVVRHKLERCIIQ